MLRLACCLMLLGLTLAGAVAAVEVGPPGRQVLVLGRVSDDPKLDAEKLQAMLDYVVPRMRSVGIREGRILMARDAVQMQSYLRRHRVDWISDTATMAIEYRRRTGARLLLATERGGGIDYHTVFFSWRGSGVHALADLRGRSLALQSTYSTSAYVLPAAELLAAGLDMDLLLSPLDRPVPGRIGYVFARSEGNIVAWVRKRLVDAGAFSNLDWEQQLRSSPDIEADLVVFHETRTALRAIEVVAPELEPAIRERLREVLLAAGSDPEAQSALQRFFGTRRFVPLDARIEAGLARLAGELDLVHRSLE